MPAASCPAVSPEPLLIDAAAVARLLSVDKKTVQRMDAGGRLPAPVRKGARFVRWRPDELRAWVAAGCPDRTEWQNRTVGRFG